MNSAIDLKKKNILHWMLEYIKDQESPPYSEVDVDNCGNILDNFISQVGGSSERTRYDWVLGRVKDLVFELNEFNEKHSHSIIETDQREGICALIDLVLQESGHHVTEDVTEEWREW